VVKNQLSQYIESNNILIPQQSGFRRNHSCETSLSLVLKQWKELVDQNKVIISVFLDLKMAFETIDRQILLQKLLCYGITEIEYEWFKSYLNLRFQQTCFNGVLSALREVQLGVLHGSVIGPLLFILYMNDIVLNVSKTKFMIITSKRSSATERALLTIDGEQIEEVQSMKYLAL
jgi:hypothetical protein